MQWASAEQHTTIQTIQRLIPFPIIGQDHVSNLPKLRKLAGNRWGPVMDLPIPLGLNKLSAFAGIDAPSSERLIH